jgi:hypothetical protein
MKTATSRTSCATLLGLLIGAATLAPLRAEVIYSNFGPEMTFDATLEHGWTINGFLGTNIGQQAISQQFTPVAPCIFTAAQLALTYFSGPNSFAVFLQADTNGLPGAVIEEIDVTGATPSPSVVVANSVLQPELQVGRPYWLSVVAGAPGVLAGWNWNVVGDIGTNTFAGTQGGSWAGPWGYGLSSIRSAFQIDGLPVPSPRQALERLLALVDSRWARPRPLCASLDAALAALDRDNTRAAVNQLRAFQNKVCAQVTPSEPVLAQTLIEAAQQVIDAL